MQLTKTKKKIIKWLGTISKCHIHLILYVTSVVWEKYPAFSLKQIGLKWENGGVFLNASHLFFQKYITRAVMQWDLGIFTAAVLTLLVLAVFQVSANRYISDGDFEDMTFSDPPGFLYKTLKIAFISPRI